MIKYYSYIKYSLLLTLGGLKLKKNYYNINPQTNKQLKHLN